MCIHGPKNSYLGKSTPHPSGQETIPILSLGASPLGIELELPLGPRDIGVDFPRYEFLGPWIHIPIRYKENFDYETMLNKIICCLIFSVKWKEGKNPINDFL